MLFPSTVPTYSVFLAVYFTFQSSITTTIDSNYFFFDIPWYYIRSTRDQIIQFKNAIILFEKQKWKISTYFSNSLYALSFTAIDR